MHVKTVIKLLTFCAILGISTILISLVGTNPKRLGPLWVTSWFIVLGLAITTILAILLYYIKIRIKAELAPRIILKSSLRQGFLIGVGATVILALSSLQQLSTRDMILITIVLLLIEFYSRTPKRWMKQH